MPLRTRIFIIFSVIVLVILAISIVLVIRSRQAKNTAGSGGVAVGDQTGSSVTGGTQSAADVIGADGSLATSTSLVVLPASSLQIDQNSAKQTARIFIERYGSFSSDNKQQNIKEVKTLVSDSLWSSLSTKIGSVSSGSDYVGVSTKVITAKITYWSSANSTVELSATRVESKNNTVKNSQQDAIVYLVKTSGKWLVDKFEWKT